MKKLIVGIVALTCSFINAPAMAATPVPKSLCLGWSAMAGVSILSIKSNATVKTATGAVKFYSILGHESVEGFQHPVHGTGYIIPGTAVLHATLSGALVAGAAPYRWTETAELFFDLALGTGVIVFHYENLAGSKVTGEAAVSPGPCAALAVSAAAPVEGEGNPFLQ
jgi:hypothetical protein